MKAHPRCFAAPLAAALLGLAVTPAAAEPIYVRSLRRVFVFAGCPPEPAPQCGVNRGFGTDNTGFFETSDTLTFGDASATASQSSSIVADGVFATGSAATEQGTGRAIAISDLFVTFDLSSAHQYDLFGVSGTFLAGGSSVLLWTPAAGSNNPIAQVFNSQPFSFSGLLLPGRYHLEVSGLSDRQLGPSTSFDVSFRLAEAAPVPEPGTLLLIASGGAVMAKRLRARRSTTSAKRA
jgi:hypothetical protein